MLNRSEKVDVSIRRTANGLRNCMESASGVKAQQRQAVGQKKVLFGNPQFLVLHEVKLFSVAKLRH